MDRMKKGWLRYDGAIIVFDDRAAVGPLASRLRLEWAGRVCRPGSTLLGEGKVLRRIIDQDMVCSMIFWGTAGSGKDHAGQNYRQPDQGFLRGIFPPSQAE